MDEKWLVIDIGGYRRSIPESKLEKVRTEAEGFKKEYIEKGIPREEVEKIYTIKIVKDEE